MDYIVSFAPIAIVVVLFILIIGFVTRYRPVPADQALIVTGAVKNGIKVVKGGGTFVFPVIQSAVPLSLRLHTLDVKTPTVYTVQGVAVMVDGVAQIKIKGDLDSIATAAEQFLGKPAEELREIATETFEGHLRSILGTMTVEEVYRNREMLGQEVQNQAATDFAKMGLQIVSFTIKDVSDENGYLNALGRPQIANVIKEAEIAEANAIRDTQVAKAKAREEGQKADYVADTNIAEAQKEMEVKKAAFKKEQDQKKAEADQSYKLQEVITLQQVKKEEMQIAVVEREKLIELEEKEIARRERQYDAELKKKADADRYTVEQAAEAAKAKQMREAEAEQFTIEAQAKATAEKTRLEGQAEADIIRQKGLAEAEAKDRIAEAMKKYGEAAVVEMIIKQFPEIAKYIAEPLSKTEKIVVIDNGGANGGASKITKYATDILGNTNEAIAALTGVDIVEQLKSLQKKNGAINISDQNTEEK